MHCAVILDILEVGKTVTLDREQQLRYLILVAHAMKFGSVKHLFHIRRVRIIIWLCCDLCEPHCFSLLLLCVRSSCRVTWWRPPAAAMRL
jgi:hypothetical protein